MDPKQLEALYQQTMEHYIKGRTDLYVAGLHMCAKLGHPLAWFWKGVAHLFGNDVEYDPELGYELLGRADQKGVLSAKAYLGYCHYIGSKVKYDPDQAVMIYRQARQLKSNNVAPFLGLAYWEGRGTEQNEAEAIRIWKEGAAMEDPLAKAFLDLSYMEYNDFANKVLGTSITKTAAAKEFLSLRSNFRDFPRLYGEFSRLIEEEPAFFNTKPNHVFDFAKKGADRHDPCSLSRLAYCYSKGIGCEQDLQQAMKLYGEAVRLYFVPAMIDLGISFLTGSLGVTNEKMGWDYLGYALRIGTPSEKEILQETLTRLGISKKF